METQTRGAALLAMERRFQSMNALTRSLTSRSMSKSIRTRVSDFPGAVVHAIRPLFTAPSMFSILMSRAALDLPFVFPRDAS
ncbi:hypothetical protein K2Y11_22765 [bacterium]|nr:hypothetical protein [bacterium]